MKKQSFRLDLPEASLTADFSQPRMQTGLVIFVHGSGSSRLSPRNQFVADVLNRYNISTLVTDLLTPAEEQVYENRFNIDLLSKRLVGVTQKIIEQIAFDNLPIGYFGASTGAATALDAAAFLGSTIKGIVCRGGRTDLASHLREVKAPVLFIAGSGDTNIINLNKQASEELTAENKLQIVEGASHLFEEAGKLDEVAMLTANWFEVHVSNRNFQYKTE